MRTILIENVKFVDAEFILHGLFNVMKINAYKESRNDYKDTDVRYNIIADIKKSLMLPSKAFCLGIQYARR
ncbi:MAG: hypothetical protein PHQ60_16540 [Sideroxydans sp.]|jgi:hypothetical protein|nr:hypothetical protein [Sideroxydans sp.]